MRISDWSSDVCSSDLRSRYYHEWLQPQDFAHTMGVTPLAEDGIVFNLSLLRSAAAGPYRADEVRRFERLQSHLRRALRTAQRLDLLTAKVGRASCGERVCQYVWISVVALSLKKKSKQIYLQISLWFTSL